MTDSGHCVTCGDVAEIATVVEVAGDTATVSLPQGSRERVGIELVAPVAPGDLVLCHAGIALERLSA
jgi:hydrogenase maturation factor